MKRVRLKVGRYYKFGRHKIHSWDRQVCKVMGIDKSMNLVEVYRPNFDRPGEVGYTSMVDEAKEITRMEYLAEVL